MVKGYHALLIKYGTYDQITSFPLPPKFFVCSMPLEMASGYYRKAKFLVFKNGLSIISDKNSHSKVLKIGHLASINLQHLVLQLPSLQVSSNFWNVAEVTCII